MSFDYSWGLSIQTTANYHTHQTPHKYPPKINTMSTQGLAFTGKFHVQNEVCFVSSPSPLSLYHTIPLTLTRKRRHGRPWTRIPSLTSTHPVHPTTKSFLTRCATRATRGFQTSPRHPQWPRCTPCNARRAGCGTPLSLAPWARTPRSGWRR